MGFCLFLSCFRFFLSFSFSFLFFFFLCLCSCFAFFSVSVRPFLLYFTYYRPAIHHIHFSKVFLISNNNDDDDDDNNNNNNNLCRISPFPVFFFFFVFRFPFVCFFLIYFFKKNSYSFFRTSQKFCHHKKGFLNRYILYQIYSITSRVQPTTHTLFFSFFPFSLPHNKNPNTHSLSHTHSHPRTTHITHTPNFFCTISFFFVNLPFLSIGFFFVVFNLMLNAEC